MLVSSSFTKPVYTANITKKEQLRENKLNSDCFTSSGIRFKGNSPDSKKEDEIADVIKHSLSVKQDELDPTALTPYIESEYVETRDKFWKTLTEAGKNEKLNSNAVALVDSLLLFYKDQNPDIEYLTLNTKVQKRALKALEEIGSSGHARVGLRYIDNPKLYIEAGKLIENLSKKGEKANPKILKGLTGIMKRLTDPKTKPDIREDILWNIKENIMVLMARLEKGNPEVVGLIKPFLRDNSSKSVALKALGETGLKGNPEIIELAEKNLDFDSPFVKAEALVTLRKIAEKDNFNPDMVSKVIPLLNEKEVIPVQIQALETLGTIGHGDVKTATTGLLSYMKNICEQTRGMGVDSKVFLAFIQLGKINPQKAQQLLRNLMINDIESYISKYDIKSGNSDNKIKDTITNLVDMIKDSSPNVEDMSEGIKIATQNMQYYHSAAIVDAIQKTILED